MSYDLEAFCRDLQDRLDWLFRESVRLNEENESLRAQNKALREEVTLARLFRDLEQPSPRAVPSEQLFDLPETVSQEAITLYQQLPQSFNFGEYFQRAEAFGIHADMARDFMLQFFRENMLEQQGTQIEKTGKMPYPRSMAK